MWLPDSELHAESNAGLTASRMNRARPEQIANLHLDFGRVGYGRVVRRPMALLLLLVALGVVFFGAWLHKEGWSGWGTPALIVGALFALGAGMTVSEISHDVWREDQPLDGGPREGRPLLTAALLAVVVLALVIGALAWFGKAGDFVPWFS